MGRRDSGSLASSGDDVRSACARCGKMWPGEVTACLACGGELGDETSKTILDDHVHMRETLLLGVRGASVASSPTDTMPDGKTQVETREPNEAELSSFAADTEEVDGVTVYKPRKPSADDPLPRFGSSDPPTRFLRGRDQHIELPSGSIVDDYEIEAKLGAGTMGVVYAARHVKLGRRVAIKVIAPTMGDDPQALARFEREARALASLHHPSIVDVFAFGALPDRRCYFVMDLLIGEPLDARLARGRVALDEALDVVDQVARGLEVAHAQGIVHRDLKPSNTFLARIPREQRAVVKLLDFGLAKLMVNDGAEQTASGAVIGTSLYISPEQARGPNVDGRTDVYALGCIAYELVLGRHPFPDARNPLAAIAAHLTEPPPQPRAIWPGIPAALDLLLYSMLAKDPNYRPTLAQVRNVVASVLSPATNAGRAMRAATVSVTGVRSRAWTVVSVAIALLAGIAIGARVLGDRAHGRASEDSVAIGMQFSRTDTAMPSKPDPNDAVVNPTPAIDPGLVIEPRTTPSTTEKPTPRPIPSSSQTDATMDVNQGALTLDSKPWTDVLVDDERKGRTPIVGMRLHIGRHRVTLINASNSIDESFFVDIQQGRVEKIAKDYDRPELKIDARTTKNPFGN